MFKRSLCIFIIMAIVMMLLVGCGGKSQTGEEKTDVQQKSEEKQSSNEPLKEVTIRMSNWLEAEKATEGIFKDMLADFQSKNPNIKVESVALPFNNYKDQVLIAASGGNPADVIMGNSQMMVAFNGAGALEPLDTLINKEVIDDIIPNNLNGTTFGGKVMALSWAPHPNALFYNKDLFKLAGLDPEVPPKTWDEMTEAAKKIADLKKDKDGNAIYGIAIPCAKVAHAGTIFMGLMYSFGGEFEKDGKIVFDNEGTRDALKYLKDLIDAGVAPSGVEAKDIRPLFATGKVGMVFDGDMGRSIFRSTSEKGEEFDKSMGIAIMPVNKTSNSETIYTEHQLGIAKASGNKKEAAALVEYLIGKDAMLMYHKSNSILSARKSIAALPEMNEDDYMKVFNKQGETARPLPASNPMFDNAMLEVTKAIERVTLNKEDIDTVVKETQAKIEELYSK